MMIRSSDVDGFVHGYMQDNPAPYYEIKISKLLPGTLRQNRAFHGLLFLYWHSGCCSDECYDNLRNRAKLFAGESAVRYWVTVRNGGFALSEDMPENPDGCIAKSWSNFSSKMRSDCITRLIDEMVQAGVSGAEFDEIITTL